MNAKDLKDKIKQKKFYLKYGVEQDKVKKVYDLQYNAHSITQIIKECENLLIIMNSNIRYVVPLRTSKIEAFDDIMTIKTMARRNLLETLSIDYENISAIASI